MFLTLLIMQQSFPYLAMFDEIALDFSFLEAVTGFLSSSLIQLPFVNYQSISIGLKNFS